MSDPSPRFNAFAAA